MYNMRLKQQPIIGSNRHVIRLCTYIICFTDFTRYLRWGSKICVIIVAFLWVNNRFSAVSKIISWDMKIFH